MTKAEAERFKATSGKVVAILWRSVATFGRVVATVWRLVGMFGMAVGIFGRVVATSGKRVGIFWLHSLFISNLLSLTGRVSFFSFVP